MLSSEETTCALLRYISTGERHPAKMRALDARPDCRVLSLYCAGGRKILVITLADRSLTTLLLPEEC